MIFFIFKKKIQPFWLSLFMKAFMYIYTWIFSIRSTETFKKAATSPTLTL